ncbi:MULTISPECIES: PadR family transcriptional regulator [Nocardiaceae]|uniref:PadR family transcriptional regulator n=1 Tax=Nocardiaceae TaxID=85025 RepID=UPI00050CF8B2|nr:MULTISPECIES: PadR family transcriptional regulator [Rhodococcus]MBY4207009.1 PadR family transcriptional regulator [Rhodococcus fascians]OZD48433.1 PadR family transcriptional regulator [Rhodococcus sp. 06-1474-1B]OZD52770.1 PadR family transcriptional regulator [Rhodococcus sp. 06-1477-1B]
MSLRDAVLAALVDGEMSGYDLSKAFDATVANFWTATPQQLYRELDRMDRDEVISARLVEQDGRPNKRLFSLTDKGRAALRQVSHRQPKLPAIRDEHLVAIHALEAGDLEPMTDAIRERMQLSRDKLARYDRMAHRLLDGRTETEFLATADRIGPYLTLMRGRMFEEESLRWGARVLEVLDTRAERG